MKVMEFVLDGRLYVSDDFRCVSNDYQMKPTLHLSTCKYIHACFSQVTGVGYPHGFWLSYDDTLVIKFNCRGDDAKAKIVRLKRIPRTRVWLYEGIGAEGQWSCEMMELNAPGVEV